jgi:hypothetical protein
LTRKRPPIPGYPSVKNGRSKSVRKLIIMDVYEKEDGFQTSGEKSDERCPPQT